VNGRPSLLIACTALLPLAVDGVLYFTGSRSTVYAVDGGSGRLIWKYDPEIWKLNPAKLGHGLNVNRGVAYDQGKVFVGVLDGRLVALEAKTGVAVWSVQTLPPNTIHTITGALQFPCLHRGNVHR